VLCSVLISDLHSFKLELALFQDGSFLTDQAIEKEIFRLQSFYPENHKVRFVPNGLGWCQDNGNRSNQESKFDFLATHISIVLAPTYQWTFIDVHGFAFVNGSLCSRFWAS